jgi:hypothetical protein
MQCLVMPPHTHQMMQCRMEGRLQWLVWERRVPLSRPCAQPVVWGSPLGDWPLFLASLKHRRRCRLRRAVRTRWGGRRTIGTRARVGYEREWVLKDCRKLPDKGFEPLRLTMLSGADRTPVAPNTWRSSNATMLGVGRSELHCLTETWRLWLTRNAAKGWGGSGVGKGRERRGLGCETGRAKIYISIYAKSMCLFEQSVCGMPRNMPPTAAASASSAYTEGHQLTGSVVVDMRMRLASCEPLEPAPAPQPVP